MSKFRAGDVCVVVSASRAANQCFVGREVSLVEPTVDIFGQPGWITDPRPPSPGNYGFAEIHLRLRRPPGWDKWLFDTSGLDTELTTERWAVV